jgi:wyosine [tRNA(Phe)-imidazoG37] synthetase (radical SAM superfamily)
MIAFGPISSRRLGKSLGINNIASQKKCSYSCIYCQIGITKRQSIAREVFYDPIDLVGEIEKHLEKLNKEDTPDYLTFVANGEPTLDINLGKEIHLLKKFNIPVAVITNSSLINDKQVQDDLLEADWISLKVDTVSEDVWRKINCPLKSLNLEKILSGIIQFSSVYKGCLHTETMLLKGYNDSYVQLEQTASFIASLNQTKAYLSIPIRPPAEKSVKPITKEGITEAWQVFQHKGITTELLTGFEGIHIGYTGNAFEDILNVTAVHPLREDTMSELLKQDKADDHVIKSMITSALIKEVLYKGKIYYVRNYPD